MLFIRRFLLNQTCPKLSDAPIQKKVRWPNPTADLVAYRARACLRQVAKAVRRSETVQKAA